MTTNNYGFNPTFPKRKRKEMNTVDQTIYTYASTGWLCQDCGTAEIDEYGCQGYMKSGEPICVDCCHCDEHDECDPCEYWVEVKH